MTEKIHRRHLFETARIPDDLAHGGDNEGNCDDSKKENVQYKTVNTEKDRIDFLIQSDSERFENCLLLKSGSQLNLKVKSETYNSALLVNSERAGRLGKIGLCSRVGSWRVYEGRGEAFRKLVHEVLSSAQHGPMTEVAKRMGMLYNTFYSRINGRVVFSPEEVRDLVAAAPDRRFLEYLVDGTPFCIELRAVEEMTHANPGTEAFHKLSCACGLLESAKSLLDETEDAIVDRVALCGAVERSKRVLTDLRRCLVADS